jgi:ELWxxDGT repeat protein
MDTWRSLALVWILTAACGPAPGEDFLEEEQAWESSARGLPGWRPCETTPSLTEDIRPGPQGSRPRELVDAAGELFFTADDGTHGRELWMNLGRGATFLVKDIRPGVATSNPRRLVAAGDKLFFTADDGVHGRELWVSDGTAAGTVMVKDIWPGFIGSAPDQLLAFEDVVYFAANDGRSGNELWVSDGTPEGTFLVEDLYPGEDPSNPGTPASSNPRRLARAGDGLYFLANEGGFVHVWHSTGCSRATRILTGSESAFLFSFTAAGSSLFFLVDDNQGQASLWRSRSRPAEYLHSFPGLYPHDLTAVDRKLFFSAGAGEEGHPGDPRGEELWGSDGTERGTVQLKDLWPGAVSSAPASFVALNGWLYFTAQEGAHGRELWRSDGTARGTTLLRDLVRGMQGSSPQELAVAFGKLFFSADTPGRGREPWMSDGTSSGTVPLRELAAGEASSDPQAFTPSGWDVFFTATEAEHGEELWALPFGPWGRCRDSGGEW